MGVIEGFYGPPWTFDERAACIDVLARHGGNAYVWAPKSDPRHRDAWLEPFTAEEVNGFARLAQQSTDVDVSVGLTPGVEAAVDDVIAKLAPVLDAGCQGITLCFDDLPELAAAERHRTLANSVADRSGSTVWLVPTHYAGLTGSPYLSALLDGLRDDILVMWTGEHVVNDTISAVDARQRRAASQQRRPLVWDNTPVNDAVMTALLHIGPYVGREPSLRDEISGLLLNPMPSMRASLPTIASACAWWNDGDPHGAWANTVDAEGLRLLAEATAYPRDAHWPVPSRTWLEAVASMPDPDDPTLQPWRDAAAAGARIALAALDAIDALTSGAPPSATTRHLLPAMGLAGWLRSPVRTLGAGPRLRPVWTQDGSGRFAPTAGSIEFTESIPEQVVRSLNERLLSHSATGAE